MARTSNTLTNAEVIAVEELNGIGNNKVPYKNNSGSYAGATLWASGTVLTSNGAASAPTFQPWGRVATVITQSATPAINTDTVAVAHITGLAQAVTSFTTNLTGTPIEGNILRIDITDNGTARAITWWASFEASTVALPTTTVISTRLDIGFVWNSTTSKWRCLATA